MAATSPVLSAPGGHQRRARRRPTLQQTDWPRIIVLYDRLLAVAPTPVVALNRAVAIGEPHGPAVALALVEGLDLDSYYPLHATRADLLGRLPARRRHGTHGRRAGVRHAGWSSLVRSDAVTSSV